MIVFALRRMPASLQRLLVPRPWTNTICFSSEVDNGNLKDDFSIKYLDGDRKGIAVFSMRRFRYKNAMGHNLMKMFNDGMKEVRVNNSIRTLIVRSEVPGVFCAGADLKERYEMTNIEVTAFTNMLRATMNELENLPMPTIAALDGVAVGGGLEMALACDMRVAASNAKLGLIETSRGLIPGAGGTQRLPRVIGKAKAKELILTSRVLEGYEAEQCGIVNHCVDQNGSGDAAYQRALVLADEMATRGPIALRMAKAAVNRGSEVEIDAGMRYEEAYYAQVIPTKDRIEGMKAFLEKREPDYKGH